MKRQLLWLGLILLAVSIGRLAFADRMVLWTIAHDRCVASVKASGSTKPCEVVEIAGANDRGFIILKDLRGDTQYLIIPTERITGIEDPAVLAPDAVNYFAEGWHHMPFVSKAAHRHLPDDSLSLAINAPTGRTQDQLHIHLDCIRRDVKATLSRLAPGIGVSWAPLAEDIDGHHYRAMRIAAADLDYVNPFHLLADAGAAGEMGTHTLVLTGAVFEGGKPGFILLDGHADLASGDRGSGEDLQDHDCAVKAE